MKYDPINYNDYLELDKLLDCQKPKSEQYRQSAHDEMLFITTHQTYELWFKQVIHEIDSVLSYFSKEHLSDRHVGLIVSRLDRIHEIFKLMLYQIPVLETMTALDFLDFRDMLYPASGFQSFQFRLVENKLGLQKDKRLTYNGCPYSKVFSEEPKTFKEVETSENQPSLFSCIDKWLSRTPFLKDENFDFWKDYQVAVEKMLQREEDMINKNKLITAPIKEKQLKQIESTRDLFSSLFSEEKYNELKKSGEWHLSYQSVHAALLIQMYRYEPVFQLPFRLIQRLLDLDETLTEWRYKHALMAKRMLGSKVGTGGSSGAEYLKKSTEQHKIYADFFQLTTFFIPRSELPKLPNTLKRKLDFNYDL